jgi:hypothetical protein
VSYLCVFLGTTEYRITGNFKTYKLMEEQMVTARIAYRSIRKSKSYAPQKLSWSKIEIIVLIK